MGGGGGVGMVFCECSVDVVVVSRSGLSGRGGRKTSSGHSRVQERRARRAGGCDQHATVRGEPPHASSTVVYVPDDGRDTGLGRCESAKWVANRMGEWTGKADEPRASMRRADRDTASAIRHDPRRAAGRSRKGKLGDKGQPAPSSLHPLCFISIHRHRTSHRQRDGRPKT